MVNKGLKTLKEAPSMLDSISSAWDNFKYEKDISDAELHLRKLRNSRKTKLKGKR